jgi:hypothetical protein
MLEKEKPGEHSRHIENSEYQAGAVALGSAPGVSAGGAECTVDWSGFGGLGALLAMMSSI